MWTEVTLRGPFSPKGTCYHLEMAQWWWGMLLGMHADTRYAPSLLCSLVHTQSGGLPPWNTSWGCSALATQMGGAALEGGWGGHVCTWNLYVHVVELGVVMGGCVEAPFRPVHSHSRLLSNLGTSSDPPNPDYPSILPRDLGTCQFSCPLHHGLRAGPAGG